MDAWCNNKGFRSVTFQKKISSYSTYSYNETFDEMLPNFHSPRYYASHMSFVLQAVDRHIGKVYKMCVYRAIREEQIKCLQGKRNSGDANATISPLSSRDKRIIICKSISDTHEELARYGTFYRAFVATATLISVTPLIASPDSEFTTPEEWSQVSIQHLPDYDYTTMCNRQAVMDFRQDKKKYQEELKLKEAKEEERRKEEAKKEWGALGCWSESGDNILSHIKGSVEKHATYVLKHVESVVNPPFIVAGLWPEKLVCEEVFGSDDVELGNLADKAPENPCLLANDIDVYHGKWAEEKLTIHFKEMKYHKVADVDLGVNTIPCSGLSTTSLLQNNGVNATAVCFEVTSTGTNLDISVICAPAYWQFLLIGKDVVRPVLPSNCGAKTFVRIAYKFVSDRINILHVWGQTVKWKDSNDSQ